MKLHQSEYLAARDLFRQGLVVANRVSFKWGVAVSIEGLASIAACTGQEERAILLAGGASMIRQMIGTPLSERAQTDFEQFLAPARATLGKEAAEAEWTKGRNMKIEQIVGEALEVM
jgi:hypothetical protein